MDPDSCATAQVAQRSVLFWNLGLMRCNRNEPQPLAMPSPEAMAPIKQKTWLVSQSRHRYHDFYNFPCNAASRIESSTEQCAKIWKWMS